MLRIALVVVASEACGCWARAAGCCDAAAPVAAAIFGADRTFNFDQSGGGPAGANGGVILNRIDYAGLPSQILSLDEMLRANGGAA